MTDSMAEIQHTSEAALAFIGGDDFRFQFNALGDQVFQFRRISLEDVVSLCFKASKQFRLTDHATFDGLIKARSKLSFWKRGEHLGVNQNRTRLVKGPDQVLPGLEIHACLTANRRVHLRQNGCRDLNDVDPAHVDGGEEPGYIADNPTAQSKNQGASIGAEFN